jgi:hypothetical protein
MTGPGCDIWVAKPVLIQTRLEANIISTMDAMVAFG